MKLETEYIKKNIGFGELLWVLIGSALRGFASSMIIVMAALAVMNLVAAPPDALRWVAAFCILHTGAFVWFYLNHYKKEIQTFPDFLYTDKFETDFDELWKMWATSTIVTFVLIALGIFASQYSRHLVRIAGISLAATSLVAYARWDRIKSWWDLAVTFGYGFTLGIATYGLGGLIGVSGGVLGWPVTVVIVVLEVLFTTVYTYMELLAWVKKNKEGKLDEEEKAALEELTHYGVLAAAKFKR